MSDCTESCKRDLVAANVFGSMLGGAAGAWVGKEVADWQQKGTSVAGSSSSRVSQPSSHGLSAGPRGSSSGVIHPAVEHSPLAHSTGTPVQENWSGDDWRSDFKEANHDAYFAPAYYEMPRQGSSRESVLMQGVNAVDAFGDAFSSGARGMVHELARHPVQSVINTVKSLGSTGRMLYDVDNQVLNLIGLPHSVSAAGQASRMEMGAWHALRSEVSQFETGTAVQKAAMLGSAALFVAESLGAGGAISSAGRLAFSASRLGRVGLFGRGAEGLPKFIKTPYGKALQSKSTSALEARSQIEQGAWLYRGGKLGRSAGPEAQFWSLENPLNPGYAEKYGIPLENAKFDFIEVSVLKSGSTFITREAPGMGVHGGGGIEVVVNAGEPRLQYFHMPWEPEYDSVQQRFIPKY